MTVNHLLDALLVDYEVRGIVSIRGVRSRLKNVRAFMGEDRAAGGGLRMSGAALSERDVIEAIESEPNLAQADKCKVLFNLFRYAQVWSIADHTDLRPTGCPDPTVSGPSIP